MKQDVELEGVAGDDGGSGFVDAVREDEPDLVVSSAWLERFDRVLCAERVVFVGGAPGSGKTRLMRAWAASRVNRGGGRMLEQLVPPGWTGPADLLGRLSADGSRYETSHVLDFLLDAIRHPDRPHVLVLDEADASPPERWFATLGSALASGHPLALHDRPRCVGKAVDEDGLARLICNADCASCFFVEGGAPPWKTEALSRCVPPRLRVPVNMQVLAGLNRAGEGVGGGLLHRAPMVWTEAVQPSGLPGFDALPADVGEGVAALEDLLALHGRSMGWGCARAIAAVGAGGGEVEAIREKVDEVLVMRLLPRFQERGWREPVFVTELRAWFEGVGRIFPASRDRLARLPAWR